MHRAHRADQRVDANRPGELQPVRNLEFQFGDAVEFIVDQFHEFLVRRFVKLERLQFVVWQIVVERLVKLLVGQFVEFEQFEFVVGQLVKFVVRQFLEFVVRQFLEFELGLAVGSRRSRPTYVGPGLQTRPRRRV